MNEQAEPLLQLFCQQAKQTFNDRIVATFKIGSLGSHGDFSACSDVDVALLLDSIQDSDKASIDRINDTIKQSKLPYSDRLSIFWSSYQDFATGAGRFPALDRLDFIEHGILLEGLDQRERLSKPSAKMISQESMQFINDFMLIDEKLNELLNHPETIAEKGARYFTKFVLFPVRLLFSIHNPGFIGSNNDAVNAFTANSNYPSNIKQLVTFAYQARNHDAYAPVDLAQTKDFHKSIKQLYLQCLETYESQANHGPELLAAIHQYIKHIKNSC